MPDINITGSYHKPFWFPFASVYVPVTPCVLDGSLSFLEMVWKLLRDLNKTIEATNANHTDILSLVNEINTLYGTKLSYIEVNFTQPDPMTAEISADTDYTDIVKGYADGIVLGRFNDDLYIALAYEEDNNVIAFYSLNGVRLRRIADNENRISYNDYQIITDIGGTITGVLNLTHTPASNNEAANKKYVDDQDAATLQAAKTYADQQDAVTLQAAKTYADQQDAATLQVAKTYANQQDAVTLQAAKTYADQQDAVTLQAAKTYADQQDAATLQAAKTYADQNFVGNNGNSGNTYGTRSNTDRDFTDIPSTPTTITINDLLAKLGRWYQEISNKVVTATITKPGADYVSDISFDNLYSFILAGQEVRCTYENTVGTRAIHVLRIENYSASLLIFHNNSFEITIDSQDAITVTPI